MRYNNLAYDVYISHAKKFNVYNEFSRWTTYELTALSIQYFLEDWSICNGKQDQLLLIFVNV